MNTARRPRRRRIAWIAGGTLLALAAAVLAGEVSGWPFLRHPAQKALARATAVPVLMEGRFRLHLLFDPGLQVQRLRLGAGGGLPLPHLLDARDIDLGWRWADLWRWHRGEPLRVQRLHAGALDAQLVRMPDGRASWQLGDPARARPPAGEDDASPLPRFGSLRVRQGLIVVDDQPLDTQLRVALQGGEGDAESQAAGYRAQVQGRWRALPMDLRLRTGGAMPFIQDTLEEAEGAAQMLSLHVEGRAGAAQVRFEGQAGALLGARSLQGAIRVAGPSLAKVAEPLGVTLPSTPPFELGGHLVHAGGVWHLQADRAAIGSSRLQGDFRHDTNVRPPRLVGRLGGPRLALADLGPAVGTPTPQPVATGKAKPPDRRVLPDKRFDLPSLKAMDADVQIALGELDFGTPAMAPLRQVQTHLLLQGGVLHLQDLKASAAGGRFSGSTRLDASGNPARWGVDLRFAGIDIAGWLRGLGKGGAEEKKNAPRDTQTAALRARRQQARAGGAQPAPAYLTGTLQGRLQLTGAGQSTAQILSTLDGQAALQLRDGTISHLATEALGLDLAQALGVMVRGDRPLPLRCARLDLTAQRGVLQTRRAVIDNADSTVRIAGRVNLADETLALQARSRPKDMSPLSLRSPIQVGGTLGAPQVGIDGKKLAGKVIGSIVLGALVTPLAALLPLVDPGEDEGDPCAEPPPGDANAGLNASGTGRGPRPR